MRKDQNETLKELLKEKLNKYWVPLLKELGMGSIEDIFLNFDKDLEDMIQSSYGYCFEEAELDELLFIQNKYKNKLLVVEDKIEHFVKEYFEKNAHAIEDKLVNCGK